MLIDYIALRSIKSGHAVDTAYQIDIGVEVFDKQPRWTGHVARALSGNAVTTTHEYGDNYQITTVFLDETDATLNIYNMREFLDSVRLGEVFQLNGSDATLENLTSPYTENHIGYIYKTFAFAVRVL